ncbi:POU domain, class 6, transcription factor 1 isoform 3-T3 [Liasis olivaceus]
MDTETVPSEEASLTVNEQVIVMSGHETIRVLEVGVDAPLSVKNEGQTLKATAAAAGGESSANCPLESSKTGQEGVQQNPEKACRESGGEVKALPEITPVPIPGIVPFSQVTSQPTQTLTPVTVQAAPQVLTQENLATVVTGVMVPAGAVTQPLLIPISIAGQVASQQGLAVWTFPAATVAALPGLTAASPTGGIFKSPIANLQAAAVLNTAIQAPLQPAQPFQAQPTAQPRPAVQTQTVFQPPAQPALLPQPTTAATPPAAKPLETQTQITVQPAGFAGIISAASLGAPTQLLSSLAATPVIANTIPSVQGITGQILTNAQGQVQPIQPAPTLSQPTVVIASPPPASKLASTPVPITCSETPTVSQLVSKPQPPNSGSDEDGINLEEIREFAKNFKIRRLSLGLTQTQVGQALTATEGPAYSQSAICRFEKLDITPKSAQKLKPVLEKWLSEAELRNQEGQQNLMEFVGGEPSKKRKRRTSFTPQAIEALNAYFEKNALPTGHEITEIAKELNYDREVVRVWFCNRRQTLKNTSKLNVFQIP